MSLEHTRALLAHKHLVGSRLTTLASHLVTRALVHDDSKFSDEEYAGFEEMHKRLYETIYGSEEYRATIREFKPEVQHHYEHNHHHPEHYQNGIAGMTLLDLIEMLCDWAASSTRQKDGDLRRSLPINVDRFKIDPQLASILENTIETYF